MDLRPENVVEFSFLACDNNTIKGYQCSRSETRTIRFPSIQEIISETRKKEALAMSGLRSASKRQKNVADQLKRLSQHAPKQILKLSSNELKRILITEPDLLRKKCSQTLENLQKKMEQADKTALSNDLLKKRGSFNKALQKLRKSIPSMDALNLPPEEQIKALDRLHNHQLEAKEKLSSLHSSLQNKEKHFGNEKHSLEHIQRDMEKNLQAQEDLKDYLQSKIQSQKTDEAIKNQLFQEQREVIEDVDQAVKELEKFVQKSMEQDLFSEDLLEKIEKVRELLQEALPDSLLEMMRNKIEGQEVDAGSLHQRLQQLVENRESFEQSIDRAVAMLERLRDARKLEEWKKQLSEYMQREGALHKDLKAQQKNPKAASQKYARQQYSIRKECKRVLEEIKQKSEETPGWQKLYPSLEGPKALGDMSKVENTLKHPGKSSYAQAADYSKSAENRLKSMIQGLSDFASKMNSNSVSINIHEIEMLLRESLQLARLQQTAMGSESQRHKNGWHSSPASIYANCNQVAKWMNSRIQKMGAQNPFIGSFLLTQSRLLVSSLNQASLDFNAAASSKALKHNYNVTRELLKLLKLAKSMPLGDGQGGDCEGPEGGQGEGQGEGQGGSQDLSSMLKGISGKQMAINQATSSLLKTMLEGRKMKREGQSGTGETNPQGLANRQGEISEELESMAEAAGEEGQAAHKLRRLAEEARAIEKELRRGRIRGNMEKNQERFKSRLLEASKALKERGFSSMREGVTSKADQQYLPAARGIGKSEWILLIEKEKKRIKKLNLSESQHKTLNEYYQMLLTR
jgi:hypothetical protein